MLKMIVSGCNGHMGQAMVALCAGREDMEVVAGFNRTPLKKNDFPVYAEPMEYGGPADAVVDFSNPANLEGLLAFGLRRGIPLVLCTTGYDEAQLRAIDGAARVVPIFRSGNMSLGVNLLRHLVRRAAAVLGADFDVEIVERHHRRKVDAPSGTALMLAEAAASALPYEPDVVYERHSVRQPRGAHEIGISSIRGGTVVGEHEVLFAGPDELLELRHAALSREVFASGALAAARYIAAARTPGLYDMDDMLKDLM